MFCKMILDYENYDDGDSVRYRHTSSPMGGSSGSLGSTGETSMSSFTSIEESDGQEREEQHSDSETVVTDDYDEEEEITCYCRKPYGGRPMIECSTCGTWVHLTCAKVKRTNIPDTWNCSLCKPSKHSSTNKQSLGAKSRARRMRMAEKRRKSKEKAALGLTKSSSKRTL